MSPADPASRRDDPPPPPPHDRDDPPASPTTLADDLLAYAQKAASAANRLTSTDCAGQIPGRDRRAVDALAYMRAAREALQARQIADAPLDPDERAATARLVLNLRRDLETVRLAHAATTRQRDDLAAHMRQLADDLAADHLPNEAAAIAGQLRRLVEDVLEPDPAEEALKHG